MNSIQSLVTASCFLMSAAIASASDVAAHWNQFRGPAGNGVSTDGAIPLDFDESRNVRWKTAIPDEGWSSPVVWENEVWVTTGSDAKRELHAICLDLETGRIVKDIKVFDMIDRKVDPSYVHDSPHLNSPATPTPVVQSDRVYVHFGSQGIACLDRVSGEKVWERRDLRIYQPVRQGSSPILDSDSIYLAYDGTDQQFVVALDKATGKTRWQTDRNVTTDWDATLKNRGFRPKKDGGGKPNDNKKSFATATIIQVDGRRQLIAPAAEATIAYDPKTGQELWRVLHPGGFNVAARPIHAGGLVYVFTSGLTGYLMGIRPDGSGDVTDTHVAWSTTRGTPHIPSPVIIEGLLFTVTDKGGIARCLDARTGEESWKKRLGGDHWASPILVGDRLYFCSKQGDITVMQASRDQPRVLAANHINGSIIASPAVAGESLILRSTTHVYCIQEGYQRSEAQLAQEVNNTKGVKEPGGPAMKIDWEAAYQKLLEAEPDVKAKVASGNATKQQVIAWLKQKASKKTGAERLTNDPNEPLNFYAIVVGRLKSKDIELGELTMEVDHVTSMYANHSVKDEIVGKTVRVRGISGPLVDNLLQIKRGETFKVRSGTYVPKSQTLTIAHKFHVLEAAPPFRPEDYGVPPEDFRGFRGVIEGKIIETGGYELMMNVSAVVEEADDSESTDANSIVGKRARVVDLYRHKETYDSLHVGDVIRVKVRHAEPRDELSSLDQLEAVDD